MMPLGARVALFAQAIAIVALSLLASRGAAPSTVLVVYALALLPHAVLSSERLDPKGAFPFAAAALTLLVLAPPVFSDDLHRYVWDGRLLAHGISPYAAPPSDPSLAPFRDASFERINHPRIATVYPPLAELLFASVSPLGQYGPKLLSALAALGLVALVRREEREGHTPRGATFALASFPPLWVESALEGHIDTVALLALVAGVIALRRHRIALAAAAAALSVLTKLLGVVLLPALLRERRAAALAVAAALLLALVPLVQSGGSARTAGLAHYARRWEGASPGFALVESLTSRTLLAVAGDGGRGVHIPFARVLLPRVQGTPLDPRLELGARDKSPSREATLHVSVVAPFVARVLVGLGLLGLALHLARREPDALRSVRTLVFAALLVVPRMLPWYALHLAPLDVLAGRRGGLLFGAFALLGHVPVERWSRERVYVEPTWAMALGACVVLVFAWREARSLRD